MIIMIHKNYFALSSEKDYIFVSCIFVFVIFIKSVGNKMGLDVTDSLFPTIMMIEKMVIWISFGLSSFSIVLITLLDDNDSLFENIFNDPSG